MNKLMRIALAASLLVGLAAISRGEVSLNSVRVTAKDPDALARFYSQAFGLQEVNRLQLQNGVELFLNFGASAEAARANSSPQIVIMQTADGPGADATMHVIFTVSDAVATANAVKAAGGTIEREPFAYGTSGMMIGFAIDPEGNHLELIQPASR
jgi:predicted enzyme related to lactoylglutathione lyase